LPEEPGKLFVKKVTAPTEIDGAETVGDAYDIWTDMENGTFVYDLYLPVPADQENAEVKYSEDGKDFEDVDGEKIEEKYVVVRDLDHFTTFVVVEPLPDKVSNGDDCTVASISGTCYNTIQAAIDAAISGDTINVMAGTYEENVYINKAVSLIGEGKKNTTISNTGGAVITIDSITDPITISGFTIDAKNTKSESGIVINPSSTNITIKKNKIINFTENGITISNSDKNTVANNTIIGSASGSNAGIYLDNNSGGNELKRNKITLATSGTGNLYDIYFAGSNPENNLVKKNIINGGNRAFQQDGGVSGEVTFLENKIGSITGPSFAGIYLNGGSAIISGNTISNSVRPIEFWGVNDVTITDNILDSTTYDFINIGSFTGILSPIQGNAFLNMGVAKLHNRTASSVDATENYWGDMDPSDNVQNSGGGDIIFCPWLDAVDGNPVGDCLGEIQGRKYEDKNKNGYMDAGSEYPGIKDWKINLYDSNWSFLKSMKTGDDSAVSWVNVDDDQFRFENLQAGTYYVCEEHQLGAYQNGPSLGDNPKNSSGGVAHTNATAVGNGSPNSSNEEGICWEVTVDASGDTVGTIKFGNVKVSDPSTPDQIGYNENNGDPFSSPRPPELLCTGAYTNINGISVHWEDVSTGDPTLDGY
jgi:parallel beta-helix repeat protein